MEPVEDPGIFEQPPPRPGNKGFLLPPTDQTGREGDPAQPNGGLNQLGVSGEFHRRVGVEEHLPQQSELVNRLDVLGQREE